MLNEKTKITIRNQSCQIKKMSAKKNECMAKHGPLDIPEVGSGAKEE